jgi:hypothetical protein
MPFKGRDPVRNKLIINSDIMEQINTFTEPGSPISYQNEKHITVKNIRISPSSGSY